MSSPLRLSRCVLPKYRGTLPRPVSLRRSCLYHSKEYHEPVPFSPAESAILSSAYGHVPAYGFSSTALMLGARQAGYLDVSTQLLPRGVFDLVNYHLVTQRLALKDAVQFPEGADSGSGKQLGIGAKVRTLALARLRANEPIIHRWQEVSWAPFWT